MLSIGSQIKTAREAKGLYQDELAKIIGVKSGGVISNWEKGINKPDAEKIVKLCKALDISLSYLLDYNGGETDSLSIVENTLIDRYRALDTHGKEMVDTVAAIEYKRVNNQNHKNNIHTMPEVPSRTINIYDLPVSAGVGIGVSGVDKDESTIDVVLDDNSRRADYALRVKGNSMETRFSDGDVILVKNETPIEGELGVVLLNGIGYFKKIGKGRLISFNPEYADIVIKEEDNVQGQWLVLGKAKIAK